MTGRTAGAEARAAVRGWLGVAAGFAALVLAVLALVFAGGSGPTAADVRVWEALGEAAEPWWDVAQAVDFLGEPVGAVVLVAGTVVGCLAVRRPRAAVLVVAAVGVSVAVARVLKSVVGRTIHGAENLSFPSGHTAFLTAFVLAVVLVATGTLGLGRAAGAALVVAAGVVAGGVMGWAQVVVGAHYPTDVVGGWCTAMAVVPVTARLVDRAADAGRGARS
ncbi:phosphatase PAP2 family protein [Streptomyces sp. LMG1-1-1.1]|uniref:phosphatase PAP2 family protein n=1 Tax=Streptomyces sp. LMG1-1-1.1 TaxID=3135245 RepID=UPI00346732F3